jgi:hypothetical protein
MGLQSNTGERRETDKDMKGIWEKKKEIIPAIILYMPCTTGSK